MLLVICGIFMLICASSVPNAGVVPVINEL
jgi:hypothetical protein